MASKNCRRNNELEGEREGQDTLKGSGHKKSPKNWRTPHEKIEGKDKRETEIKKQKEARPRHRKEKTGL